jgi:transcription elongation factor Elf1
MKLIKDKESSEQRKLEENNGEKPGRCPRCDQAAFSLSIKSRILSRTCKNCGDVKEF